MLFVSFAHRLLLVIGTLAVVLLILLLGTTGILGPETQGTIQSRWNELATSYANNKVVADWILTLMGAVISAGSGAFAIYKSWYYAEINLPKRLQQLIEKDLEILQRNRPALVAAFTRRVGQTDFSTPIISRAALDPVLASIGISTSVSAASALVARIDTLASDRKTLEKQLDRVRSETATAHYLRGAWYAAKASEHPVHSATWRSFSNNALDEYLEALSWNSEDADILEALAQQCRALGDVGRANDFLDRLICVAEENKRPFRRVKAIVLKAELLEFEATGKSLNDARVLLEQAAEYISNAPTNSTASKPLELAKVLLALGRVQRKREKFSAASRALDKAASLFANLHNEAGRKGIAEVQKALDELELAKKDPEDRDN